MVPRLLINSSAFACFHPATEVCRVATRNRPTHDLQPVLSKSAELFCLLPPGVGLWRLQAEA